MLCTEYMPEGKENFPRVIPQFPIEWYKPVDGKN